MNDATVEAVARAIRDNIEGPPGDFPEHDFAGMPRYREVAKAALAAKDAEIGRLQYDLLASTSLNNARDEKALARARAEGTPSKWDPIK